VAADGVEFVRHSSVQIKGRADSYQTGPPLRNNAVFLLIGTGQKLQVRIIVRLRIMRTALREYHFIQKINGFLFQNVQNITIKATT
jgi:hypothetical protein